MTLVLIVDDNPMDRRLAGGFAEQCGMSVAYAGDGEEALSFVTSNQPDIVLTDLEMPVMNGLQLVHQLRHRAPMLPVILMTARGSEDIASEALRTGASSYVRKRNLQNELVTALNVARSASAARERSKDVFRYLSNSRMQFEISNDHRAAITLVSYFQDYLEGANLCSEEHLLPIGTALLGAMLNAIDHGNLQLPNIAEGEREKAREQRAQEAPYKDRKVTVTMEVDRTGATFVIADEGDGFDTTMLSDPADPANLTDEVGRGLVLIQSFMDEVSFNETGNEITMRINAQVSDESLNTQ